MIWQVALKKAYRHGDGQRRGADTSFAIDLRFDSDVPQLALVGPSGSGKTQTLRMLAGITSPDDGRIAVAGRTLYDRAAGIDLPSRDRRLGYVFQDYALFPHLTVRQNIGFALRHGIANPRRADEPAEVARWIRALQLEGVAGHQPHQISGGQRQRTALARALVAGPAALLLDEPFAALDTDLRAKLRREMRDLQRDLALPTLLVTHDEADAAMLSNAAVRIDAGTAIDRDARQKVLDEASTPEPRAAATQRAAKQAAQATQRASQRRQRQPRLQLDGGIWVSVGGRTLGGIGRMDLLRAVAERGSITQAAKAVGLSYKAAWDAVDAMNRMAGEPLVERGAGGRGGGFTALTAHGSRLLERFEQIDAVHRRFLGALDTHAFDLDTDFSLLRTVTMKTSARNQFVGTVTAIRSGAVNDEVEIAVPGGPTLVAVVTRQSTLSLGLRTQMTAMALIKSSSVLIATDLDGARLSARNQLAGTVSAISPGAVNSEVTLDLDGGGSIAAIVTQGSAMSLGLKVGARATALFKASSVIVGVLA